MNKKFTHHLIVLPAILLVLLQACSGPDRTPEAKDAEPEEEVIIEQPDTVLFWTVDNANKIKARVYKDSVEISNPESVINGINSIYPSVQLKFVRRSGDTIYAHIDSAKALTSDMGSFGASEYISTVVLNLTTLDSVNFVNLDFPEGSHAAPGVFSKRNYESFKEKEQ